MTKLIVGFRKPSPKGYKRYGLYKLGGWPPIQHMYNLTPRAALGLLDRKTADALPEVYEALKET